LFKARLKQSSTKVKHGVDVLNGVIQYLWGMSALPLSVLIIESHPLMRAALCAAIADEPDMTIAAVAANGTDIMRTARLLQPNIVLLGLDDPGFEELQTLIVLRKRLPAASILVLTRDEIPEQKQAALRNGAQATLNKNAPRDELLRALRQLSVTSH
jgi:DNA-binding NarL/FixJ family response regulator